MNNYTPFAKPLYVMAKPIGSLCNLECDYCYYLEKKNLYNTANNNFKMSNQLLDRFIEQYILSQTQQYVSFVWHGGEPLLRSIDFYKRVVKLQNRFKRDKIIENSIQTNGTLLNDEWCKFFKENNWLVGISIDGPKEFHDKFRKGKSKKSSFDEVMRGINLLKKHQVEWNAMAVVNNYNADYPIEFYNFFKDIECRYIQFSPIVERIKYHSDGRHLASLLNNNEKLSITDSSVTPKQWGRFICAIFDEWVKKDVGSYFIQLFDATLANWMGVAPSVCTLAPTCGHAGAMEYNGDLYSCDHFVFPEYKLGNIYTKSLIEMMYSEEQITFGLDKKNKLPNECLNCKFLFACNGECPKNRFSFTKSGESGLNYLCEGFYKFFEHVTPYMNFMKNELDNQRPPANIIQAIRNGVVNLNNIL